MVAMELAVPGVQLAAMRRRFVTTLVAAGAATATISTAICRARGLSFAAGRTVGSDFGADASRGVALIGSASGDAVEPFRRYEHASTALGAATFVALAGLARASRRRGCGRVAGAAGRSGLTAAQATTQKSAAVEEKQFTGAKRVVERLFAEGKKSMFAPNAWYESPDKLTVGQKKVWEYWKVRPTRRIERIDDGKQGCGCTWSQLDGTRGVSFFRINTDGEVTFVREVAEVGGMMKSKTNTVESLSPILGVMGGIANMFNTFDSVLEVFDKSKEAQRPKNGLRIPKSQRAQDVVRYLFEEAQFQEEEEDVIDFTVAQYSADAVLEDMTVVDEAWPRGIEAVRKFQADTKKAAPSGPNGLRFILDEITDGDRACTVIWHVEVYGQKTPRGVSFYEVNDEGKVSYVRQCYSIGF